MFSLLLFTPLVWTMWQNFATPRYLAKLIAPVEVDQLRFVIGWIVFGFGQFITTVALMLITYAPAFVPDRMRWLKSATWLQLAWITALAVACAYCAATTSASDAMWRQWLAASTAGVAVMYCGLMAAMMITLFVDRLLATRFVRYHEGPTLLNIVVALHEVQSRPDEWLSQSFRRRIMFRLDAAANALTRRWWRGLASGDIVTDEWLRETCVRGGAGIRSLKTWLASPSAGTRDNFIARLRQDLDHLLVGNVAGLEQIARRRRTIRQRLAAARTALLSVVPILMLGAIQHSTLRIEGPLAGWLTVGAYLWAVVGVLAAVDPALSSKLSMLKDVRSLLGNATSGEDR